MKSLDDRIHYAKVQALCLLSFIHSHIEYVLYYVNQMLQKSVFSEKHIAIHFFFDRILQAITSTSSTETHLSVSSFLSLSF